MSLYGLATKAPVRGLIGGEVNEEGYLAPTQP